jgi:enoyl reductase-like protein
MQVSLAQTRERKCDSGAHAHPRRKVLLQVRVERAGHGGAYRLKNRSEHLIKLGFAITRYFQNIILFYGKRFLPYPATATYFISTSLAKRFGLPFSGADFGDLKISDRCFGNYGEYEFRSPVSDGCVAEAM